MIGISRKPGNALRSTNCAVSPHGWRVMCVRRLMANAVQRRRRERSAKAMRKPPKSARALTTASAAPRGRSVSACRKMIAACLASRAPRLSCLARMRSPARTRAPASRATCTVASLLPPSTTMTSDAPASTAERTAAATWCSSFSVGMTTVTGLSGAPASSPAGREASRLTGGGTPPCQPPGRRRSHSRFLEGLVHEHHRDVAHDRVDAVALDALQALLDDRLLAAELLAELVAHGGAPRGAQRDHAHLFLAERARQNLEQFSVNGHGGEV